MSGTGIALVAVGVLTVVVSVALAVLVVEVRRLRAELAAPAASPRTGSSDLVVARTTEVSEDPSGRAAPATHASVAPTNQAIVVATLGHPLVRVAAISHGVRQALTPENRDRIRSLVRRDLRRREKLRRRAAKRAARVLPLPAERRDLAS